MSSIYKHWKTVVTAHVSTSKMHEFSHFGLKRLAKKSQRRKKPPVFTYYWGKAINKLSKTGKIRRALHRMLVSYDQVYNLQANIAVLCTACSQPEEPLHLLPFPSLACGFPSS